MFNTILVSLMQKKTPQEHMTFMQRYLHPFPTHSFSISFLISSSQATFGLKAKTNFVYEAGESIVPNDFLMMQPTAESVEEPSSGKVKGSHPRRTYVGIKARRKRMSESDNQGESSLHGNDRMSISTLANHSLSNSATFIMPPRKRLRHGGLSSAGSDGDGHGDWREQLYHWRGHLSVDSSFTSSSDSSNSRSVLLWSGTWVGSWQQVAGTESTLAWTGNTFTYRGPPVVEGNEGPASMSVPLKPISGTYLGHYMMDNEGSGRLSRYSDHNCYLDFKEDEKAQGKYTVIGRGDCDFGAFILQGIYDSASRALDITRKYIPDSDPRSGDKISLHELRASLARDPVKIGSTAPIGMLGSKSLDVTGNKVVVAANKEIEI